MLFFTVFFQKPYTVCFYFSFFTQFPTYGFHVQNVIRNLTCLLIIKVESEKSRKKKRGRIEESIKEEQEKQKKKQRQAERKKEDQEKQKKKQRQAEEKNRRK